MIINNNNGATIFGFEVDKPEQFGVIEFDKDNKVKIFVSIDTDAKLQHEVVAK